MLVRKAEKGRYVGKEGRIMKGMLVRKEGRKVGRYVCKEGRYICW